MNSIGLHVHNINTVPIGLILFSEGLKEYFGQFGDIADGMVMKDPMTKRSRLALLFHFLIL